MSTTGQSSNHRAAGNSRVIRVLFLNTRDSIGADVAVHISLMRSLDREKCALFVASNSQAFDIDRMQQVCASIPDIDIRFIPLGLPASQLSGLSFKAKCLAAMQFIRSFGRVFGIIRREKIQIIHSTDRPRDAFFCTLLAKCTGISSLVHMHSNAGDFLSRLTKIGLRQATVIAAVSKSVKSRLIEMGLPANRIHVVYNAIDATYFDPEQFRNERQSVRENLSIPIDAPVIGIVARLIEWKGHYELLDSLKILLSKHETLRLLIVGTGASEQRLRDKAFELGIHDSVVFAGHADDVPSMLAAMDIFALPSYEEPFGLAIIEAMAMELPVVACSSGGAPEIIDNSVNGVLVKPRNSYVLAEALGVLLASPERRSALGKAARLKVLSEFTPAHQAQAMHKVYSLIASGT